MKQNALLRVAILPSAMMLIMLASITYKAYADTSTYKTAILAGGCFWCVESDFDKVPGVVETTSGYIGGKIQNPSYRQVASGQTEHIEAVKVVYDPKKISYDKILFYFWRTVDPTDKGGQFCDRGASYRTAIFAVDDEQLKLAQKSKADLEKSGALSAPIVTEVRTAGPFYKAESGHQDFYRRNPVRYATYRYGCRRDARVKSLWGKQAHGGLKKH
ncbi:MAG: peptide-methionine (S)-S-oxide reductase MsrA [Pseudomonadota bacterium]